MAKGYFTDDNGDKSMTRLLTFSATMNGMIGGSICALVAVWRSGDMGPNTAMFFLGLVGVGGVTKAVSKFGERYKATRTDTI